MGIMQSQSIEHLRQCKYNMEIGRGQKLMLSGGYPFLTIVPLAFRTMSIAARVVTDAYFTALITSINMSTQRRCPTFL
jgi:hypothetical protein